MKKRILSILLIIIFTALVLYFSLKDDYEVVINTLLHLNKWYLIIGFFLIGTYWFFKSMVMWLMTHHFKKEYRFRQAVRMTIETNFFHAVTPFSTGGQPYEIYSLKKAGVRVLDSTNISIQSFITYQIALVFLGTVAIISNFIFNFYPSNALLSRLVTIGFIANFLVIVGLFVLTFEKKLSKKLISLFITILAKLRIVKNKKEKKEKINAYLNDFHTGATILFEHKTEFFGCIALQFLALIAEYLIPFALIMGSGIGYINPLLVIVTSAYVMLIGSFVPIPGGTGGLEYGFVAFFSNFIKGGAVNAIMLVWRFITYYFGMILGAIVLSCRKKVKKDENRDFY